MGLVIDKKTETRILFVPCFYVGDDTSIVDLMTSYAGVRG